MIIRRLTIQAFGQFTNKTFDFSDGLNVIYGLNESGKTTLHAFIEGILYGFFNPTIKVRRTLEAYDIYKPKHSASYGGSLTIELDGKLYIITRDLLQNTKDALTILNEKTGEDITKTLDVHPVTKQADIEKFIGIPYLLYQNTLSIKTLPTDSDGHVGDMLMTRLQNIMTTKTETLSTKKALESLEASLKTIGSDSARTKPYAQTLKTLKALETEREDALDAYNALLEKKAELERRKDDISAVKTSIKQEEALLKRKQNEHNKIRYQEALSLQQKQEKKQTQRADYDAYKDFDPDTLEHYVKLESTRDNLESNMDQTQTSIASSKTAIEQLTSDIPSELYDVDTMKKDQKALYQAYRDYDAKKHTHLQEKKAELESQHTALKARKQSVSFKQGNVFMILLKIIGCIIVLPLQWLTNHKYKKTSKKLDKIKEDLSPLDTAHATMESIFSTYDVSTVDMFDTRLTETQTYHRKKIMIKEKEDTLDTLTDELKTYKEKVEAVKDKLNTIKKTYDITSYEELKSLNQKRIAYDDISKDIDYLKSRLEDKLSGETLESLESTIDTSLDYADPSTIDETKDTLKGLTHDINDMRLTTERLSSDISHQETMHRPLEVIDHDITDTQDKLTQLESQKDTINKAIEMIQTSAQIIEENFAPVISQHIESYLSTFTLDRYQDIKVSKFLTFKVYDTRYQSHQAKTHFSEGTKDQVYFAMRLGILDALHHTSMPLLLDDAFANFDAPRLQKALTTLESMTKTRQILLFTCHEREASMLKDNTITATYHTL